MPIYNKLIRDKIPSILDSEGKTFKIRKLHEDEYQQALLTKFEEEYNELVDARNDSEVKEELADILEVIYALSSTYGSNIAEIEEIRKNKRKNRGGFDKKLFLQEVFD